MVIVLRHRGRGTGTVSPWEDGFVGGAVARGEALSARRFAVAGRFPFHSAAAFDHLVVGIRTICSHVMSEAPAVVSEQ